MSRPSVAVVIVHDGKGSWCRPSDLHVKLLSPPQAETLVRGDVDLLVQGAVLSQMSVRDLLPLELLDSADFDCG